MINATSLTKKISERKSAVDLDINSKIKHLQRKLVSLSFSKENVSDEYYRTLEQIKTLRRKIFNGQ